MKRRRIEHSGHDGCVSCLSRPGGEVKGRLLVIGSFMSNSALDRYVSGDLANRLSFKGWHILVTSRQIGRIARLFDMLQTVFGRRADYDVALVDVFSGPAFSLAEAACWLLRRIKKPFILTLHGGNLPSFALRWPRRMRQLLTGAVVVTTPSNYLQKEMRLYRDDILYIPNGIALDSYHFRPREMVLPKIMWLRAFHDNYNPTMGPRVIAELILEFPNIELAMAGPDKGDGSFMSTKRLAAELGVNGRLSFPGVVPKDEVPQWLQRGDIFINTTNYESFGVALMEAAACGLCIVSTNVGEVPYLWSEGKDSLLVASDDTKAMAFAVRRILIVPGLAKRLAQNARAKAEEYDWFNILRQWESLLSKVSKTLEHSKLIHIKSS